MHAVPLVAELQVERDWQWKVESKDQEIASLTTRTRQVGGWRELVLAGNAYPPGCLLMCALLCMSGYAGYAGLVTGLDMLPFTKPASHISVSVQPWLILPCLHP